MKRVLLTAVALLFGAAAFAQPSASVETLARKYADRDGALVMRLDSTMVGLVKLRVAALPDSLRRSAALLDKVSGMTNIMLMTGLARTLDPAADTTAFVRLESDFRADVAALTAEPVRRRLFREREAGVEVAGYYSAAPSGEAELVLVVSGGGNEALCVLGARQIGKTTLIREFAKQHYEHFVEINFIEEPRASSCSVAAVRDRARRATERKNLAVFSACREKSLLLCHLIVLLRCKPIFW